MDFSNGKKFLDYQIYLCLIYAGLFPVIIRPIFHIDALRREIKKSVMLQYI